MTVDRVKSVGYRSCEDSDLVHRECDISLTPLLESSVSLIHGFLMFPSALMLFPQSVIQAIDN